MSQSITITYISPGTLTWSASDSSAGTFAGGTSTTVLTAGQAAVAQVKAFLSAQGTSLIALGTGLN